jgi:hypothetical protein
MGHISLNQIKRSGEGGRGMALAGIIVGWAGLALLVIMAVLRLRHRVGSVVGRALRA